MSLGECFLEAGELFFEVLGEADRIDLFALLGKGGGGDSLGERNFMGASLWEIGGECEDDLLSDECFLNITGEFLEVLGDLEQ